MDKHISTPALALRLWFLTNVFLFATIAIFFFVTENDSPIWYAYPLVFLVSSAASAPALLVLGITLYVLRRFALTISTYLSILSFICLFITLPYCVLVIVLEGSKEGWIAIGALFVCELLAMLLSLQQIKFYFINLKVLHQLPKTDINMDTHAAQQIQLSSDKHSNKILVKAIITAILIMAMLVPTFFVSNLVAERKTRQQEVVKEVSAKWANAQTISGPYIMVPYTEAGSTKFFTILPDQLDVKGTVTPEERPRSIYKVLLYKTQLTATGSFLVQAPADVDPASIVWSGATVCLGISDLKGIEEKVAITCNQANLELMPGLPTQKIDSIGLSAALTLATTDVGKHLSFSLPFKLRGSEQLHFVPLGGNSAFNLQSTWRNPSFDGNNLPNERNVNDAGFTAKWTFNKANLPFKTVMKDLNINKEAYAFGLSMVQPADQYAKTDRSVKYALLFIGLTFALFFIIELLQKKPVHPVQYILVGIALVVFYTLLLSIGEFILFNYAYAIAATATVLLIALYAKGHFGKWSTAGLFALVLSALYAFIFVLISLEDTALLVGSIGLFIVLALIMFASRKINWYNPTLNTTGTEKELSI